VQYNTYTMGEDEKPEEIKRWFFNAIQKL